MTLNSNARDEQPTLSILNPLIFPLVPHNIRPPMSVLWETNRRLSALSRGGYEPALRQIKLRWWADQLAPLHMGDDRPDPLLTSIAHGLLPHVTGSELAQLAEAWMAVAGGDTMGDEVETGASLFTMSGRLLGTNDAILSDAGRAWAGVEQAMMAESGQDWAKHTARFTSLSLSKLPRALAALTGLARRISQANGRSAPRREQLTILRIGLFGC